MASTGDLHTTSIEVSRLGLLARPDDDAGIAEFDLDRLLATEALRHIDADRFPSWRPLRELLRQEAVVQHLRAGDILVREGDYGSSVFFVLSGTLRVLLDNESSARISGRRPRPKRSLWRAISQHFALPQIPEQRDPDAFESGTVTVRPETGQARQRIRDLGAVLRDSRTVAIAEGQMLGEIAALTRSPRTATVFAENDAEVVELRWQGLRELRQRDPGFRHRLDELYRSRNLVAYLREIPLLRGIPPETLDRIAPEVSFENYGTLDWNRSFKGRTGDLSDVVSEESLIAEEGDTLDGLLIIRSGFARVSRALDHGHRTIDYLSANEVFGLDELVLQNRTRETVDLRSSLRAVGYVDILRIPTDTMLEHVLPCLDPARLPDPIAKEAAVAWSGTGRETGLDQSLLDALVDHRIINGQASMLIDTDRCVDCNECVVACSITHDNNPRFVRHGPVHANLTFTTACMHCVDPVCLVGCPTGAIHRRPGDLRVTIDDPSCIGCGTCADACPYENIRMVEIRNPEGGFIIDASTQLPVLKATKCDLCQGQFGGPACERACPHDALIRTDMRRRRRLKAWIDDPGRSRRRWVMGALAAASGAAVIGLQHLWTTTLEHPSEFTGWVLLVALATLMAYGLRKRLPGLPLGKASTWRRVHLVLGTTAAIGFVVHAGPTLPQGNFEAAVWLGFVTLTVAGGVGVAVARWLPARLQRHGQRVLPERIPTMRRELSRRAERLAMASIRDTASSTLADYHTERIAPFLARQRNLWYHLIESDRPMASMRNEIRHLRRYLDDSGRAILAELERIIEDKNNLDYQAAMHAALRGWRFLHGPVALATSLLVVLHVVLVLAFSGVPA